jgi:hypothetical protein
MVSCGLRRIGGDVSGEVFVVLSTVGCSTGFSQRGCFCE